MQRFVAIPEEDRPVLAALMPLFALITASTMVSLTYARSLFVAHHPYGELPLMFIVAAAFTAVATLVYLPLMKRWQIVARFRALLLMAAMSFILLTLSSGIAPAPLGTLTFAWTAGVSQLLVLQVWSYSTWLLPIRRARHLFPLLAAAATTGAMVGGGISMLIPAGALLSVAAVLLTATWVLVGRASTRLAESKLGPRTDDAARPLFSKSSSGGLRGAVHALFSTPLLRQLALLAVALQVSSLCLDVQLSAAAKSAFAADELAVFFGAYYAISNGVTLGLSVWGAERLAQRIGLGWVAALPAWPLLVGAACVMVVDAFAPGDAHALLIAVVVLTSLSERIVTFGAARQAFGAAMTPVDARESERARFLIDGVLVRGATVVTSVALIFGGLDLARWATLAPAVFIAAFAALLLVRNVGAAYRQALMDGLEPDQLSTIDADDVRRWASKDAEDSLRVMLASDDILEVSEGLRRCAALGIAPPADTIRAMLATDYRFATTNVPTQCLQTLSELGTVVPSDLLRSSLHPAASTSRQRAALLVASKGDPKALHDELATLRQHRDPLVRSLACALYGDPPEVYGDTFKNVLKTLLTGYTTPVRRTAMQAALTLAALRSDALIDPLLDALHSPDLTPAAYTALRRLSPGPVSASIRHRLADPRRSLSERIRLLRLAELIGQADAIMPALEQDDAALRDRAIEALWRLSRRGMIPSTPRETVAEIASREVALLLRCASIDQTLAETDTDTDALGRSSLVRAEVALRRTHNEQRVFRLLSLVYGRDPMDRAFKHYRSPYDRSRSNAIELLDATVGRSKMQPLVAYIEVTEHRQGRAYTSSRADLDSVSDLPAALADVDPLLGRMYAWSQQPHPRAETNTADGVDRGFLRQMDRVLLLSRISLFSSTPAAELMVVAEVCKPAAYHAGEIIFRPGDPAEKLYLIERGQVEILRDKRRVAQFNDRQAFGELAIVGDSERNTTARAMTDLDCLVLARSDFSALLDVSPSLAKGAIAVLAQRLRQTLERLD